jgi:hypothetical protein
LISAGQDPDRAFVIKLHSKVFPLITHALVVGFFEENGGKNYVECQVEFPKSSLTLHHKSGTFILTMQRKDGKTPNDLKMEAEAERDKIAEVLRPFAENEHYRAVGALPLFSKDHWEHNAGSEWPEKPDDDSYQAFENCQHPLCVAARSVKRTDVVHP